MGGPQRLRERRVSCKDCKTGGCEAAEGGCGPRKERQRDRLSELIAALYPGRCWGEPELSPATEAGEVGPLAGVSTTELMTLASELATVLKTPCYIVPGDEEDLCHFIYILCLGREPSLLELRDEVSTGARPTLWLEADRLRERYLRVSLSLLTRIACVQEVALELDPADEPRPGEPSTAKEAPLYRLRELPLPGVFTAPLLKRMQRTVDLLEAHGIEHLDMGLLDVDASAFGLTPGDYEARYGSAPALLNYFFYAQPVQTATVSWLPAELRPSVSN